MPFVAEGRIEEALPLYQRIENALRERIADGTWAVGQALPGQSGPQGTQSVPQGTEILPTELIIRASTHRLAAGHTTESV